MTSHILVVDDEADVEKLITMHFRNAIRQGKYLFTFARNGKEAYQQVSAISDSARPNVDVVLTDISMPVMDGLMLLNQLNDLAQPPKTVVMSAYGDMANIRKAMNNGAFDFIPKPIEFKDLTITLERTLAAVFKEKATQARLKQAHVQFVQSEKMLSLGRMVAGVVHEINNPVNFIYGNVDPARTYMEQVITLVSLYQQRFPDAGPEIQTYIEKVDLDFLQADVIQLFDSMETGAIRILEIVLSLRNFSRLDEFDKKRVDIHEGIESTLVLLNNRLKATPRRPRIEVIRKFGTLPAVDCYPSQLNQVVMNIVSNAIDALEEDLDCAIQPLSKEKASIQLLTEVIDTHWIRLTISDNGPGISEKTMASIFDPFFTTKPVGHGTGLGLFISYQIIVEKHGGKLFCESVPNKGTQFMIELPITSVNH